MKVQGKMQIEHIVQFYFQHLIEKMILRLNYSEEVRIFDSYCRLAAFGSENVRVGPSGSFDNPIPYSDDAFKASFKPIY